MRAWGHWQLWCSRLANKSFTLIYAKPFLVPLVLAKDLLGIWFHCRVLVLLPNFQSIWVILILSCCCTCFTTQLTHISRVVFKLRCGQRCLTKNADFMSINRISIGRMALKGITTPSVSVSGSGSVSVVLEYIVKLGNGVTMCFNGIQSDADTAAATDALCVLGLSFHSTSTLIPMY